MSKKPKASQSKGHGPKGPSRPVSTRGTKPAPPSQLAAARPWGIGALLRAFLVGFFLNAALVRIVPINPALAFLIGGIGAGLASAGIYQALATGFAGQLAALGVFAIPLAQKGGTLPPNIIPFSLVAVLVGALLGWWAASRFPVKWLAWGLLAVIVIIFVVQVAPMARVQAKAISVEMPNEKYSFDPVFFVKVFYLQERGIPFYQAYGEAFAGDARFDKPTPDLAGWRSPTTSTLWSVLFNNASQIVWAFVLLAAAMMVGAYYVSFRLSDEVGALIAPAMLAPYYLAAVRLFWFTEYELWAAFFVMASAVFFLLKKRWPALGFAVLAGAMREWLISATMAGAIHSLLKREWKRAIPWVFGVFAVAAVYVANMVFVRRYLVSVGITPSVGTAGRLGGGGPGFILYTLKFCADFLAHPIIVPYYAFALALIGAVRRIVLKDYFTPALLLLPLAAFMIFGSGQTPLGPTGWNDYYNGAFWPFALVLIPAAWGFLLPSDREKPDW